jgi:alpha-galactosidase
LPKITLIGAGSHVFSRNLITDLLTFPELRASTISLMDINQEKLELVQAFTRKLVKQQGFNTRTEASSDLTQALTDADYVIVSIRVGGFEANSLDVEIPAKYGLYQGVGDTIGPGGVFYGLRHVPVILNICREMEDNCPEALLLNYTNPMAILTWAINDYTKIQNIGLCHSVVNTATELARYLQAPLEELYYWVAGINHMAWFLELKLRGTDAYPLLRERFKDALVYSHPKSHWAGADIVRAKMFKTFGYFITESSQHLSEYLPYFRRNSALMEEYKLVYRLNWMKETTERRRKEEQEMKTLVAGDQRIPMERSSEPCTYIIHSIETGVQRRINGNVKNNGLITNLPQECIVEVPCLVDGGGIHPCFVGELPKQCAALNRTNVNVQDLAVKAAHERSKELVLQAILMDPLTSAILTLEETEEMVEEMFHAEKHFLPEYF